MKIAYICHPIMGDIMGNVEKIMKIVRDINLDVKFRDVVPFVPYLSDVLSLDDNKPEERNRGLLNCITILKSGITNELWIYGPKISGGMRAEIDLAYDLDIPIVVMDPQTEVPIEMRMLMQQGYDRNK
jgi:hypothetical protein